MKKILSVLLVLGAITATAEDSYLYWMVGDDTPADYAYAKVNATTTDGTSYLTLYDATGGYIGDSVSAGIIGVHQDLDFGLYAGLASSAAYSSFVIELYNDSDVFIGQSIETLSSAAMAQYVTTANGIGTPPAMWAPTGGYAIPEPNSGLLMLIGCAVLGLRRRRQRKV